MRNLLVIAALLSTASLVHAAGNSVNLDFNGSGSTLAATGFENAYNLNPAGFTVGGGSLAIKTLDGDTFGNYGGPTDMNGIDPDTAQNFFYSTINPLATTVVNAKITATALNQNYHGGGIWMGTDTDHYLRLGIINNGGVIVEALRENQDFWSNNEQNGSPHGPGNDIVGKGSPTLFPSSTTDSHDVYLRIVRNGHTAQGFYSFDNVTFTSVEGFTFDGISTSSENLGVPGATASSVEDGAFKVGAYAIGGGTVQATIAFDSFSAVSTPEPASLAALALGGLLLKRRRA